MCLQVDGDGQVAPALCCRHAVSVLFALVLLQLLGRGKHHELALQADVVVARKVLGLKVLCSSMASCQALRRAWTARPRSCGSLIGKVPCMQCLAACMCHKSMAAPLCTLSANIRLQAHERELTFQLAIVSIVHKLIRTGFAAEEALLVRLLHVLEKLIVPVHTLPAEPATQTALSVRAAAWLMQGMQACSSNVTSCVLLPGTSCKRSCMARMIAGHEVFWGLSCNLQGM